MICLRNFKIEVNFWLWESLKNISETYTLFIRKDRRGGGECQSTGKDSSQDAHAVQGIHQDHNNR